MHVNEEAHVGGVERGLVDEADAGHEAHPEVHERLGVRREARQVAAHVELAARRVHPEVVERVDALQVCESSRTVE